MDTIEDRYITASGLPIGPKSYGYWPKVSLWVHCHLATLFFWSYCAQAKKGDHACEAAGEPLFLSSHSWQCS
jgi:hypothetical protein